MFPLRDDNPTRHASAVTFLLVAVNVAVWIFVQGLGLPPRLPESIWRFGMIPGELLGRVPAGLRVPLGRGMVAVLDGDAITLTSKGSQTSTITTKTCSGNNASNI